jgi:hypothetical protein
MRFHLTHFGCYLHVRFGSKAAKRDSTSARVTNSLPNLHHETSITLSPPTFRRPRSRVLSITLALFRFSLPS